MSPEQTQRYYCEEGCGYLALALHQVTGWPLAVLYDEGLVDDWGRGDEPTPVHAFVVTPQREALDVYGSRAFAELHQQFLTQRGRIQWPMSREQLLDLMGDDRPFYALSAAEMEEAHQAVAELGLLDDVTSFPPAT